MSLARTVLVRSILATIGVVALLGVTAVATGGGATRFADLAFVVGAVLCGVALIVSRPTATYRDDVREAVGESEDDTDADADRSSDDPSSAPTRRGLDGDRTTHALTLGGTGLLLFALVAGLSLGGII